MCHGVREPSIIYERNVNASDSYFYKRYINITLLIVMRMIVSSIIFIVMLAYAR